MSPLSGDLFARRLRQERVRLGISQAELARRMAGLLGENVESTRITRIEQGTRAVRLDEAVAAAESLGVPLIALLSEDAARENEAQIQERLAELAAAERLQEKQRHEVARITREIQLLTAERERLRKYARDVDPKTREDYKLDPEHQAAIDARITDPGA